MFLCNFADDLRREFGMDSGHASARSRSGGLGSSAETWCRCRLEELVLGRIAPYFVVETRHASVQKKAAVAILKKLPDLLQLLGGALMGTVRSRRHSCSAPAAKRGRRRARKEAGAVRERSAESRPSRPRVQRAQRGRRPLPAHGQPADTSRVSHGAQSGIAPVGAAGESCLTAAIPMDNPYCSCELTRVRRPTARTAAASA